MREYKKYKKGEKVIVGGKPLTIAEAKTYPDGKVQYYETEEGLVVYCDEIYGYASVDKEDKDKKYSLFINKMGEFQIRALRDFENVKRGDLGGEVENENSLSQSGNCWIGRNGNVFGNARVTEDALVGLDRPTTVEGNALISGSAVVEGAFIEESAVVKGAAEIRGEGVYIKGHAVVDGNCKIFEEARIGGSAHIGGNAVVCGWEEIDHGEILHGQHGDWEAYWGYMDYN